MTTMTTMPNSLVLKLKLDLGAPALRQAMNSVWRPDGLRERYLDYLSVMHAVIRASVPLMQDAVTRSRELPGDPVAEALGDYFTEHITEELHHDEWLLDDLAAAGRDRQRVLEEQPSAAVARLVGPQYYWIRHHHPVGLLGYIAVLEGNAPPAWLSARLAEQTGLPSEAFRTLHHHAVADLDHSADFDRFLDCLPLSPQLSRAVSVSALATADSFADLLNRL